MQYCSVVQLAEACDPTVDPVLLGLVREQLDGHDVVGGVARGGQGASAGAGLIDGTHVDALMLERGHLPGFQLDDGQGVEQDLGERLSYDHVVSVPARPLHEKTPDVGPVLRLLVHMGLLFGDLERPSNVSH